MEKVKYEKPRLLKLGFDNEVMGVLCSAGPANAKNCIAGADAEKKCQAGGTFAQSTVCVAGPADLS